MKQNEVPGTEDYDRNIFRVLYVLDRALHEWFGEHFNVSAYPDFNLTYMPFFMNIGLAGISNSQLADMMGVTKQGASRIVRGLIAAELVRAEKSDLDARLSMLYLTVKGKIFYEKAIAISSELLNEHTKVAGTKNYELAIDVLIKLIKYHKSQG